MLQLTNALEKIQSWIQNNEERNYIFLNSGLDFNEIEAKINLLPFQLSQEVQQLYNWHNGMSEGSHESFAFVGMDFYDLERSIEAYHELISEEIEELKSCLFPILRLNDNGYYFSLSKKIREDNSPIFCFDFGDSDRFKPVLMYRSLTTMMLTIAESCETNIYRWIRSEYGQYLEWDLEEFENIRLKYNPEIQFENDIQPENFF